MDEILWFESGKSKVTNQRSDLSDFQSKYRRFLGRGEDKSTETRRGSPSGSRP